MNTMVLGLPFFAQLMQADVNDLKYVIIKRKYDNGRSVMFPGIVVCDIEEYVFDIISGQFIAIEDRSDSTISVKKADVVNTPNGIILRTQRGHSIRYTIDDFLKVYCYRVVNAALYD